MPESTLDKSGVARAGLPTGPWLLVVGMHRSGTSAMTGALGGLGMATPDAGDRWGWHEANPDHWESISINRFDEALLSRMGGSWDAPPELPEGWETGESMAGAPDPRDAVSVAYPDAGPIAWKDPRVCLVLPYWRRRLPQPLAAVLVWRSPLAVARSLQKRDGMHLADGVALWEHYNRSALANLVGIDTFVCSYESVLDDAEIAFTAIADWLDGLPQFADQAGTWTPGEAASMITDGAGPPRPQSDDGLLLPEHRALVDHLSGIGGPHAPLEAPPRSTPSPWSVALLAARRGSRSRQLDKLDTERAALVRQLEERQLALDRLHGSTTWRLTQPFRTLSARLRG